MIAFLRGEVFQLGAGYADVDVHGIGYRVWMPDSAITQIDTGQTVHLYTHHHVREDAILLYGFSTERDRDWFELLITVSGIGPKGALTLMSASGADAFLSAVANDDTAWLCTLPGIGKKTAQRLLIELKDKLDGFALPDAAAYKTVDQNGGTTAVRSLGQVGKDIVEALLVLGYNERQAAETVAKVLQINPAETVEAGLKLALRQLVR